MDWQIDFLDKIQCLTFCSTYPMSESVFFAQGQQLFVRVSGAPLSPIHIFVLLTFISPD